MMNKRGGEESSGRVMAVVPQVVAAKELPNYPWAKRRLQFASLCHFRVHWLEGSSAILALRTEGTTGHIRASSSAGRGCRSDERRVGSGCHLPF